MLLVPFTWRALELKKRASAKLVKAIASSGPGVYDIGGGVVLEGKGSSAESVSE
jgi:hypothetical protein